MNSLKHQINADYMTAFKQRNLTAKNLLSVVKGEIQTQEKNQGVIDLQDEDVIKIITKVVKGLKDQLIMDNSSVSSQVREELEILEVYLPKQMSEVEIKNKIVDLIESGTAGNIAEVMRAFSNLPADRKIVSSVYHSLNK